MNSFERVRTVLAGGVPDRVPVCLHNFMLAAREAGIPMEEYRVDPEATARAHLEALDRYAYDCLLIDTDTTMLAEAMGARSECAPGQPGRIVKPALETLEEVGRLKVVNPETDGRIPALLEAVRILRKKVGGEIAIRGNADQAAFSLACLVRGVEDFLMDLADDPENPHLAQLLEVCYQSHLATHRAVAKAGADFTSLGDSLAGPDICSPALFNRFARPYEERLVRALAADGIWVVIHICGDTGRILPALSGYASCGFELDYKTGLAEAKSTVGARHVLFGNLDPSGVVALGTAAQVREATRKLIAAWKPGGRFILNAGCAIPPNTPAANIRSMIDAAREYGRY